MEESERYKLFHKKGTDIIYVVDTKFHLIVARFNKEDKEVAKFILELFDIGGK